MKKGILFGVLALVFIVLGLIIYWIWAPVAKVQAFYLVPNDAIFIIESQEPINNWHAISESGTWNHLQKNPTFAELTADAESLDSLIRKNSRLSKYIGNRSVVISAHPVGSRDADFLFLADLSKASKLIGITNYIENLAGDNVRVTRRDFEGQEIIELYDKKARETMYFSLIENQLAISFTHLLVENAIKEFNNPQLGRDLAFIEVSEKTGYDGMVRVYVQYDYFDDYVKIFTGRNNEFLEGISTAMAYSGFSYDMDNKDLLKLSGFTNFSEEADSYLKAIYESGTGPHDALLIASVRTSFLLEIGFDDFTKFVENLEGTFEQDQQQFEEYQDNRARIEKFLKIDLAESTL